MLRGRRSTTAQEDHQQRVLEEFQAASVNLELALELTARAQAALDGAVEAHAEAKRKMRRVTDGVI